MATETPSVQSVEMNGSWKAGVGAGLAGAAVMSGLMLAMGATNVLAGAIPGLYGLAPPANPAAGLFVHLSHGAVLGVAFAGILAATNVTATGKTLGLGVVYGVVTWAVLAALVMPVWLQTVGFPNAPAFPNFAPPSLLWHLTYGVVTAGVYAVTR
jgi:hypothetical protein